MCSDRARVRSEDLQTEQESRPKQKVEIFQGLSPGRKGQNLALTVLCAPYSLDNGVSRAPRCGSHVKTLVMYKVGFNQNYYTFALILLAKIVLCSKFH